MAPLILHSYRRCPFAIRVRMVLEEKGANYRVIEESLREPSPELLQFHPEGKVPLLRHGDFVLYESAIITEYLDEVLPGVSLMPVSPQARAEMRIWTFWCHTFFKADLDEFKYRRPSEEAPLNALRARLIGHLQKIESALSGPFLQGNSFSLADIHVFPFVRQLSKTEGVNFMPPKVNAWLESILARPSFVRAMAVRD